MVEPVDTGSILRTLLETQVHDMYTGGAPPPPTPPTTPTRDVLRYRNSFHIDARRRQQCAASAVQTGLLPYSEIWAGVTRRSKLSAASPLWPEVMQTHALGKGGMRSFPAAFDLLLSKDDGGEFDKTCAIHAIPMFENFPTPIRIVPFSELACAPSSASAEALCPTETDVARALAQTTKECGERHWPPLALEDDATAYAVAYCLSPAVAAALEDDLDAFKEHTKLCDAVNQLGILTLLVDDVPGSLRPMQCDVDRDDTRRCLLHAAAARHAGHIALAEALMECHTRSLQSSS